MCNTNAQEKILHVQFEATNSENMWEIDQNVPQDPGS